MQLFVKLTLVDHPSKIEYNLEKKLLLDYFLLDLLHSNAWCIASRDLLCFQFSLRYNSPTSKVNWEPKLCVQHLQLTLEHYNFLLNWTPNFFQAILRKIIFRLRHSLISKEMSSVDPNWKWITCMYRVAHMYLNNFVRLFRGHWVS